MGVLRTGLTAAALAVAVVMLAACGGHNMANSSAPHDASLSHSVAPAGTGRAADASAEASAPHGPEIESGSVVTITDGNVQKGFPASATVERTADGVIVTTAGRTWKFSRAATVSNGGSYHIYARLNH